MGSTITLKDLVAAAVIKEDDRSDYIKQVDANTSFETIADTAAATRPKLISQGKDTASVDAIIWVRSVLDLCSQSSSQLDCANAVLQHREWRTFSVVASQLYYLDKASPTLKLASSLAARLYKLEPTALIHGMVASGVLPIDSAYKTHLEGILLKAWSTGYSLTRDPFYQILQLYNFELTGENVTAETKTKIRQATIAILGDLQRLQAVLVNPENLPLLFKLVPTGKRSANFIATQDAEIFIKDAGGVGIERKDAAQIWQYAFVINTRNEQTWATLLATKTANLFPAIRQKKDSDASDNLAPKNQSGVSKPSSGTATKPKLVNSAEKSYVAIFNEMETVECSECESVLSPAAYLVDLMKMLDKTIISGQLSLLNFLKLRRPDLPKIQLSCANTKILIPYIDLVNEILESFISYNTPDRMEMDLPGYDMDAFDMEDSDTTESCSLEPRRINTGIYQEYIATQVYPMTVFPYNFGVDSMRNLFGALGSSVREVRETLLCKFSVAGNINNSTGASMPSYLLATEMYLRRTLTADYLNLYEEDLVAITREGFSPIERWRMSNQRFSTGDVQAYEKAVGFKGTMLYWGYELSNPENLNNLSLVRDELLKRSGLSLEDMMGVLKTQYIGGRLIITSIDGTNKFTGKLDDLRLRTSVLIDKSGKLTEEVCFDLQAFIRLRNRVGWPTQLLDTALSCVSRNRGYTGTKIYPTYLDDIAAIKKLNVLSTVELMSLFPLWCDIDTNGASSLYARLFLRKKGPEVEVFQHQSGDGRFLIGDNTSTHSEDIAIALSSAFQITRQELSAIMRVIGISAQVSWTLADVSLVYRVKIFCKMLGVQFEHYGIFCDLMTPGSNPFTDPQRTLEIFSQWQGLMQKGWGISQLALVTGRTTDELTGSATNARKISDQEGIRRASSIMNIAATTRSSLASILPVKGQVVKVEDVEKVSSMLFPRETVPDIVTYAEGNLSKFSPGVLGTLEKFLQSSLNGGNPLGLPAATGDLQVFQRRAQFLLYARKALEERQIQKAISDLVMQDFPGFDAAVLRVVLSDIAKLGNLSCLDSLISVPSIPINSASIDLVFRPQRTDIYYLSVANTAALETTLQLDGVAITIKKGEEFSIRFLSGQSYRFRSDIKLSDLRWRTAYTMPSNFPSDTIIDIAAVRQTSATYKVLNRILSMLKHADLSLEELSLFSGIWGPAFINLQDTTIVDVHRLFAYQKLRDSLQPSGKKELLDFWKWILQQLSTNQVELAEISKKLQSIFSSTEQRIQSLLEQRYLNLAPPDVLKELQSFTELNAFKKCLDLMNTGTVPEASVEQMYTLARAVTGSRSYFASDMLRKMLQTPSLSATSGVSALSSAHDQLRENRRKVLITYLLNRADIKRHVPNLIDADSLFEFLLIDVNMGPQLQTSRIKQAISTVHLFVQRCFLRSEKFTSISAEDVDKAIAKLRKDWVFMSSYRLWEANRKVFLYPENWIDPTLRDDKSEQFKALESAIMQNDVSKNSIVEAVRAFIYDTNAIANLDVQAYLYEKTADEEGAYHIFARTRTIPYRYFYRRMEVRKFAIYFSYWFPWTSLDVGSPPPSVGKDGKPVEDPSIYLLPALVRGRLHLFFPEITLKTDLKPETNTSDSSTPKLKSMLDKTRDENKATEQYWEIKMAYSELRNGRWSPKVYSQEVLTVRTQTFANGKSLLAELSSFRFRIRSRIPGAASLTSGSNALSLVSTAKTAEDNRNSQDILVIDIESFDSTIQGSCSTLSLGQFEMRDSQLYRSQTLPPSSEGQFGNKNTIPTYFSKFKWDVPKTSDGNIDQAQPEFNLKKSVTIGSTQQDFDFKPLLATRSVKGEKSRTWTMSFDESQFWRPVGLVVDIATVDYGPRTYFVRPNPAEMTPKAISSVVTDSGYTFTMNNTVSATLAENANRGSDLKSLLSPLYSEKTDSSKMNLYGLFAGSTTYHELFTPSSIYNWELGVHVISLLMERLLATQQFELALEIARAVFDPTIDGGNLASCWLFPPFADGNIEAKSTADVMTDMSRKTTEKKGLTFTDMAVVEWIKNPFNAHSVARGRPVTYMKRIVIKYIEILLAAGDDLFRQLTLESIPLAIQRYIEASHIFGPSLLATRRMGKRKMLTYDKMTANLDSFSNTTIDMELDFPFSCLQAEVSASAADPAVQKGLLGIVPNTFFCVPTNPQLLALRALIDDRLFKIRNGQDINGNQVKLPLFEPPLDPGMLVKAAAGGEFSPSMLLGDMNSPMPNYRFNYLLQKAFEVTRDLKEMGAAFLTAKEKRDTEALSILKSRQEIAMQQFMGGIKKLQKEEAEKTIEVLKDTRAQHVSRLSFYLALVGEPESSIPDASSEWTDIRQDIDAPTKDDMRMSTNEKEEMESANTAAELAFKASIMETTASILEALPRLTENIEPMGMGISLKFDGENVAKGIQGGAVAMRIVSEWHSMKSGQAGRKAQMIRQLQERRLQANQTGRDIKNVDKQIEAQKIRVAMSDAEIKMQDMQIKQAMETEEWYRKKYTNEQLYGWIENASRKLFYETYNIAIDLARKAEKAYQFEQGDRGLSTFVNPQGYWDSGVDGLLSGENLYLGLKRLEGAYLNDNSQDFEISKAISLRQLSPRALFDLRQSGSAKVKLHETLFDFDFPGHYLRRIKSVAVAVPCITGPYTSLNLTLTLLNHKYRVSPSRPEQYADEGDSDERFRSDRVPITSVAVGQPQLDSGRFELDFKGERYMPFENAGLIGEWKIDLPAKVRQFDYNTISDVIFQIRYTSRQAGGLLKTGAEAAVESYLKQADEIAKKQGGLSALVDLRSGFNRQFPDLSAASDRDVKVVLAGLLEHFPFWTRGQTVKASKVSLIIESAGAFESTVSLETIDTKCSGVKSLTAVNPSSSASVWTEIKMKKNDVNDDTATVVNTGVGDWTLGITPPTGKTAAKMKNALLLIQYNVT